MSSIQDRYQRVMTRAAELADLDGAAGLIGWDQEAKMPAKGVGGRSHVSATLAGVIHEKFTDDALADDLGALTSSLAELDPEQRAQVEEINRLHVRAVRVPGDLVRTIAETQSRSTAIWAEAREKKDFDAFAPILTEMVNLKRREAEAIGFEDDIYDALLDEYEPGAKTRNVVQTLGEMRDVLVPLVQEIAQCPPPQQEAILAGPYDEGAQDAFGRTLVDAMGFDMEAGRLDVSNHPFTAGIHEGDTRLTTRYKDELSVGLFGTLHEAGHGLYEQNLRSDMRRTPLGTATFTRHSRVAVPALGKHGGAEPEFLGSLLPPPQGDLSPAARLRRSRRFLSGDQRGQAELHPDRGGRR